MILFKDILSESIKSDTVTLYRGDTKKVEKFLLQKTKSDGLFGTGIYLTDSKEIAFQYSARRENGLIFSGIVPHGEKKPSVKFDAVKLFAQAVGKDVQKTIDNILNNEKRYEVKKVGSSYWEDYWIIVDRKLYNGYVSKFEIPRSVIDNCYDAESPMSSDIKSFILSLRSEKDKKDTQEKYFLGAFQRSKSLAEFMYEYFKPYVATSKGTWKKFREWFIQQGYTGISFQGDNYLNHGISDNHRVYLFWNVIQTNKYRVS